MNSFIDQDQSVSVAAVRKPSAESSGDLDELISRIEYTEKRMGQIETCLKNIEEHLKKMSNTSAAKNGLKQKVAKKEDLEYKSESDINENFIKPELDTKLSVKGPHYVRVFQFFFNPIMAIIKVSFYQIIDVLKFWIKFVIRSMIISSFACIVYGNNNVVNYGKVFWNLLWDNFWKWVTESYRLDQTVIILVLAELLSKNPFIQAVSNVYNFIITVYQRYQNAI